MQRDGTAVNRILLRGSKPHQPGLEGLRTASSIAEKHKIARCSLPLPFPSNK